LPTVSSFFVASGRRWQDPNAESALLAAPDLQLVAPSGGPWQPASHRRVAGFRRQAVYRTCRIEDVPGGLMAPARARAQHSRSLSSRLSLCPDRSVPRGWRHSATECSRSLPLFWYSTLRFVRQERRLRNCSRHGLPTSATWSAS
jgi:hypothetical protein